MRGGGNARIFMGLVMLMVFMIAMQFARGESAGGQAPYTMKTYEEALEKGEVKSVVIAPNKETPTGAARVTDENGTVRTLYATDITRAEEMAREAGLDPVVQDIPRESWL